MLTKILSPSDFLFAELESPDVHLLSRLPCLVLHINRRCGEIGSGVDRRTALGQSEIAAIHIRELRVGLENIAALGDIYSRTRIKLSFAVPERQVIINFHILTELRAKRDGTLGITKERIAVNFDVLFYAVLGIIGLRRQLLQGL